ncbi:hypothetical protein MNBD_GAMMA18-2114, partial [hydrothermal vent metagenome]
SRLSLLTAFKLSETSKMTGEKQNNRSIQLGLAYRPQQSKWLLLNKLELRQDQTTGSQFDSESWRVINMFNGNYKTGRWQLSLQYGAKTVKETINNLQYKNFVDLTGVEARYDLSKKWDIGVHGSVLHAWDLKQYDYNSGVSVGHRFADNVWISVGYNFNGFRDEDFSRSNYTSKGIFLRFRIKFDQTTVRDAVKWAGQ